MRTVPTLCASGAGISVSTLGFAFARPERHPQPLTTPHAAAFNLDMTAVSGYAVTPNLTPPFVFSPLQSHIPAGEREDGSARPSSARVAHKRRPGSRSNFTPAMNRSWRRGEDAASRASTPSEGQSNSWLRRLSGGMSTSRDSSRTPSSRPGSAHIAHSNGSMAISHSGSTTPMFPSNRTPSSAPNKLVKRTSSARSINDSPSSSPASRLPLPVFRRPATSHQRNATVQKLNSHPLQHDRMSLDGDSSTPSDIQWRNYFTPRIAAEPGAAADSLTPTAIPNPIKRVYPDRKYTPVLVSAREVVKSSLLELDDGLRDHEDDVTMTNVDTAPEVASSPLAQHTPPFGEMAVPRRSFSIGDLLSRGPQPLWRRPPSVKTRQTPGKLSRRPRPRIVSESQPTIGSPVSVDSTRPSKRRDFTDPGALKGNAHPSLGSHLAEEGQDRNSTGSIAGDPAPPDRDSLPSGVSSPLESPGMPLDSDSPALRTIRASATHSEVTSTVGSESGRRSLGDISTDYQSDTVWDSLPTRTTRSSSGRRGPHIETLFDESPPTFSSGQSTKLRDFLNDGDAQPHDARYRHSTIEEEGSVLSTPVRSLRNTSVHSTPSARPVPRQIFSSSPPLMSMGVEPDEIDWDAPDDAHAQRPWDLGQYTSSSPQETHWPQQSLPVRSRTAQSPDLSRVGSSIADGKRPSALDRTNLFQWSEQQSSPSHPDHSPPRPRTTHGKKDPDGRGSRPPGRRPPSGMHARSHSVPVVPDVDGKRGNIVANKFGTWGVGSKAVTEDWNDDFEFDESLTPPTPSDPGADEKRIDSGHEMFIPASIRERQENVVANIGLLREWGLLIEELKDLRIRAAAVDMLNGAYAQMWREVDAMIELADQETAEGTLEPRHTPPSSPGFDDGAFEDSQQAATPTARSTFAPLRLPDSAIPAASVHAYGASSSGAVASGPPSPTRPRKDSELVAQSVIAALQAKRSAASSEPAAPGPSGSPSKKVPFDTATLRHIVPYVNGLKRRVKDALRETEGLYTSPRRRGSTSYLRDPSPEAHEPSFHSIFNARGEDNVTRSPRTRRQQAATDHNENESGIPRD